jgi:DNA-directed RNA polymerase beta' subunit
MQKRKLTEEEIQYVMSDIQPIYCVEKSVSAQLCQRVRKECRIVLSELLIYPEIINKLRREIAKKYNRSQIESGHAVGVITSQSIGEKTTQITLNTFHFSGMAIDIVVNGVPRLTDILNASKCRKNTLITIIPAKDLFSKTEIIGYYGCSLKELSLSNVVNKIKFKQPIRVWSTTATKSDITLKFNLNMLYKYRLTLSHISKKINQIFGHMFATSCSPLVYGFIDLFIKREYTADVEEIKDSYFLENMVSSLMQLKVCGLSGISEVSYASNNDDGKWYCKVIGCNIVSVWNLQTVDKYKTWSDDLWSTFYLLGIEATRELIFQEIKKIMCAESPINDCHINLLADFMTYSGTIISFNRYGLLKNNSNPLTRASFEENVENLLSSGFWGEIDHVEKNVAASIIVGNPIRTGSGMCDLLVNFGDQS